MITKNVIADKYVHIMNRVYAKTGIKLPGFNDYTNRLKAELEKSRNSRIKNENKVEKYKVEEDLKTFLSMIDDLTKYFLPD